MSSIKMIETLEIGKYCIAIHVDIAIIFAYCIHISRYFVFSYLDLIMMYSIIMYSIIEALANSELIIMYSMMEAIEPVTSACKCRCTN